MTTQQHPSNHPEPSKNSQQHPSNPAELPDNSLATTQNSLTTL